jgi:hypothetical protein
LDRNEQICDARGLCLRKRKNRINLWCSCNYLRLTTLLRSRASIGCIIERHREELFILAVVLIAVDVEIGLAGVSHGFFPCPLIDDLLPQVFQN